LPTHHHHHRHRNTSANQHPNDQADQRASRPASQQASTPADQHTSTPAHQDTSMPVCKHTSMPADQHASPPGHLCTSTPADQHANAMGHVMFKNWTALSYWCRDCRVQTFNKCTQKHLIHATNQQHTLQQVDSFGSPARAELIGQRFLKRDRFVNRIWGPKS
jgi:hypothetical protein